MAKTKWEDILKAAGWTKEPDGNWRNRKKFTYVNAEDNNRHCVVDDVIRSEEEARKLESFRPKEPTTDAGQTSGNNG